VLHFLHCRVLHLNCIALSQSESSNFFLYLIRNETSVYIKNVWVKQLCNHKVWDFATAFPVRKLFGTFKKRAPGSYSLPYSLPSLWKIRKRISQLSPFDHATWQHPRDNPRHVRGSEQIYVVRVAQFVLKIEKLSHIMAARGSQDLRTPSPIMAPIYYFASKYGRTDSKFIAVFLPLSSRFISLVPRVFVSLDQRSENESCGSNHFRHAP